MRELTLRVPSAELEDALDGLLPALPGGVHLGEDGEEATIAILDLPGTPDEAELRRLAGPAVSAVVVEEVSEDWRERRLDRYEPLVVADRFLVRPDWAPASQEPGLIEIALAPSPAFGSGVHPTTRGCMAALAQVEPRGSLVDCGCGSGVLAVAAAKLGFEPVDAVDVEPAAVAATEANAALNGVAVRARSIDLTDDAPPAARTLVANVPPPVQIALAERLAAAPEVAIVSGFGPPEVEEVAAAWARHGISPIAEERIMEWSILVLG